MNNISFFIALSIITLLPFQSTQAEVYRWKDKNGKVHFSDKPHIDATQIKIKAPKPSGIGITHKQVERRQALLDDFQKKREVKQKQAVKDKRKKDAINKYCRKLKNQLRNYQESDYLFTRDEAGEKNNLSDKQKQTEQNKLRAEIDKRC